MLTPKAMRAAMRLSSGDTVPAPRGCAHESGTRPAVHADAHKDRDAMGWLAAIPPDQQRPWRAWIRRLRVADTIAELRPRDLTALQAAWDKVREHEFHDDSPRAAATWARYLEALAYYHHSAIAIRTVEEHDEMLLRLSGPLLQLAPGMPEALLDAAAKFGAYNQYWDNIRDLQEDAARGMCWLPEDELSRYGVARSAVLNGDAPDTCAWRELMTHWLGAQRQNLMWAAWVFVRAQKPWPLRVMTHWTLRRYERIERVFRAVEFDYRRFAEEYWSEVAST